MFTIQIRRRHLGVVLTVLLVGSLPVAAAAGTTAVTVTPNETVATPGDRVTVDVVVDEARGGVGAWEVHLNLSDGTVADIVDVTLHGDPGLRTIDIAENNDSVYFDAALADTDDAGSVTIATLTLEVTAEGKTRLDLTIDALGDEDGNRYTVGESTGATISTGDSAATEVKMTETPTVTSTDTDGDESSGVVGGEDKHTESDVTGTTSVPPEEATTRSTDGETKGNSPTATSNTAAEASPESEAPSTTTEMSSGISAPGFTAASVLVALILSAATLRWRH